MDAETFADHNYYRQGPAPAPQRRGRRTTEPRRTVLQRISQSPEDVQFYTGFSSIEHLMAFWRLLERATASVGWPERTSSFDAAGNQEDHNTATDMAPLDEFLLFVSYLSTGWTMTELEQHLNINNATFSRIIITWANFLYGLLGSVRTWMTPEEVKAHLPREFIDHVDTHVVIDWIELHCQTTSPPLPLEHLCYSHTSCCVLKGIVGLAPHGAVMFVSAPCGPSTSPRDVFRQSGIIPLLSSDMAVMHNRSIRIDDLVPGQVHRPEEASNDSKDKAALKIHLEELFLTIRENKVFNISIPLPVSGSINQLFTVACLLCNYRRGPLGTPYKQED